MPFSLFDNPLFLLASSVGAIGMAIAMIFIRLKAAKKPTTTKKIILPPIFMSSGALMYLIPEFRIVPIEIVEACIVGLFFSIFLIKTTKFEIRDNQIYLIPSKAFIIILFSLLIVRTVFKIIIGGTISFGETSGMFFLLAFAMIVSWRLTMLFKYNQLKNQLKN
ncbi:cytochrome c biogenesis protein CcdC [Pseudogracilibacillus sp. SE30717A]|uniref:CcdC family protein n=1 Tax=Pseudogracilibacillus sp. SE30717A TaxID=3098293 RepID=UPI00300E323B